MNVTDLQTYIQHFNTARAAWAQLYAVLQKLYLQIKDAYQDPMFLNNPNFGGPMTTEQQLRELLADALTKSAPLDAEYHQLPQEDQNDQRRAPLAKWVRRGDREDHLYPWNPGTEWSDRW